MVTRIALPLVWRAYGFTWAAAHDAVSGQNGSREPGILLDVDGYWSLSDVDGWAASGLASFAAANGSRTEPEPFYVASLS